MKRFLQWLTGIILFLSSVSQINDLITKTHAWYYNLLFGTIYVISAYTGLTLIEKSLKD